MRLAALTTVFLLLAGGCSFGATAPTTAGLSPLDHQLDVGVVQPLLFHFSRPVGEHALTSHVTITPPVDGLWNPAGDGLRFTYQPLSWQEATTYAVAMAALTDLQGNPVGAHHWTFTTTIQPRVVMVTDGGGNPLPSNSEVELGTKVTLIFNTPMDTVQTSVTAGGGPAAIDWSADGLSATLTLASFPIGPLVVALASGQDRDRHFINPGWQLPLDVAYVVHIATRHLPFPALVQVPNDGYGARPQVGIQAAAMVFEYQTEGSIQRLTAVYTDAPDVVGPTRSGRRISFRLVRHYHGNLFLSGLSDDAHAFLNAHPVPAWFDNPPGFYRDLSRSAPDNLMLRGDSILFDEQASGTPAFEPLVTGRPDIGASEPAPTFGVAEHRSTYAYDPATGTYGKVEDGETMSDASLGKPDQMFMVLVLHADEFLVPDIENGCCTHGRDFNLDSGGGVDIYYRGQHATGSWSAADPSSPLVFKNAAGTELLLPKGLVWVDVVGN